MPLSARERRLKSPRLAYSRLHPHPLTNRSDMAAPPLSRLPRSVTLGRKPPPASQAFAAGPLILPVAGADM